MISLIVTVYNVDRYLGRCVSSIISQTYGDFELILVDDGSTDGSLELCVSYAEQDNRVVVIHKENGGLVSARKAGIAVAQGEYVGFIDGDDWIEPEMYMHLMEAAAGCRADMVLGGCIEDVNGQISCKRNRFHTGVYDKERLRREIYPYMLCAGDFCGTGVQPYSCNKEIRREVAYVSIMAVDSRIRVGEDVAAVIPMLLRADRVAITDDCDYHYCIRSSSMMWEQGSAEAGWRELEILNRYLRSALTGYRDYDLVRQLNHYTVGNMLTRTFGLLVVRDGKGVLWPFGYRGGSRKCILYGAGNFGRAVYGYLQDCYPDMLELWVDREYRRYQSMGLPVRSVDNISAGTEADVLVAILDLSLADLIRNSLMQSGVRQERIYCVRITEDEVSEIIGSIC